MTISLTATLIVAILGVIAIVVAATKEGMGSQFWFNVAFWVTALALLGGIYIR